MHEEFVMNLRLNLNPDHTNETKIDKDIYSIYKLLSQWHPTYRKHMINKIINLKASVKKFRREMEIERLVEDYLISHMATIEILYTSGEIVFKNNTHKRRIIWKNLD